MIMRLFKRLKRLKNSSGITLVELIVSFALLGILITSASAALGMAYNVGLHTMGAIRTGSVAGILMEELTNEIGGMSSVKEESVKNGDDTVKLCDEYGISVTNQNEKFNSLTYVDENGHSVVLSATDFQYASASAASGGESVYVLRNYDNTDGLMHIFYKSAKGAEGGEGGDYGDIDWHYDENMYLGCIITGLKFTREPDDKLYKVELELTYEKTGYVYSTERYIKCYNL